MINLIEDNLTLTIAIYGAILSTATLFWNIYNNLQDKPKVKVKAGFGFMTSTKGAEGPFLFVEAINNGKRSIYLSSVGLRSGKNDLINMKTISLPYELKGRSSHNEWFEINELKNRQFDFAWYRDATGKLYKSKSIKKKLNNYFKKNQNLNDKK